MPNDASSITVLGNGRATDLPPVPGRAIWKSGVDQREIQTPFLQFEEAERLLEDDIQRKPGFQKLMIKLGDRHKALGVAVDLWQLAQKYWYPEKKLIPLHVFQEADLPECLCDPGIGLAEKREDGIYARGSEDQFAWLFDAVKAGKKSAELRKQKYGSAQPGNNRRKKTPRTTFEQPSNGVGTPPKVTEPPNSLLSSHSSFLNTQNSNLISNSSDGQENLPSAEPKSLGSQAFEGYSNAYREKYKEPPVRNKKINSLFKQLGERLGVEAPEVAHFYLSHSDFFYIRSKHSVELLLRDAEKLRTEWKTGTKTTSISSRKSELDDHNSQVIEDYKKSKQPLEREVIRLTQKLSSNKSGSEMLSGRGTDTTRQLNELLQSGNLDGAKKYLDMLKRNGELEDQELEAVADYMGTKTAVKFINTYYNTPEKRRNAALAILFSWKPMLYTPEQEALINQVGSKMTNEHRVLRGILANKEFRDLIGCKFEKETPPDCSSVNIEASQSGNGHLSVR